MCKSQGDDTRPVGGGRVGGGLRESGRSKLREAGGGQARWPVGSTGDGGGSRSVGLSRFAEERYYDEEVIPRRGSDTTTRK